MEINRKKLNPATILLFLFTFLFVIESFSRLLCLGFFSSQSFLHILLFTLVTSLFLTAIAYLMPVKRGLWFVGVVLFLITVYAISQVGIYHYLGVFYSFSIFLSMYGKVHEFTMDFFELFKWEYLLLLLPLIIYVGLCQKYLVKKKVEYSRKILGLLVMIMVMTHFVSILSLHIGNNQASYVSITNLYDEPIYAEKSIREFGLIRYFLRDFQYVILNKESKTINIEEYSYRPLYHSNTDVLRKRIFEDKNWISLKNSETNENLSVIDEKLMERYISPENEYTGIFEGKNLVMLLVESFDYASIDPILTPNLYKLAKEGWLFENYFTPKSTCSTGDSELMALVSIYPTPSKCSYEEFSGNRFRQSLFELFNDKNYYTSSYHDYWDKFYERNAMHRNLGSSEYWDADDLGIDYEEGWPSDVELIEKGIGKFVDKDSFFTFLISVSMHVPYDVTEEYVSRNLEVVRTKHPEYDEEYQVYLAKAMETDKAIGELIAYLKVSGQWEDTVLVLFADHKPPTLPNELLIEHSDFTQRDEGSDIFKSPLIIYSADQQAQTFSNLGSTIDLTPTLANLFNLNYDPRMYLGIDMFDDTTNHNVFFQNGDWISDEGYFYSGTSEFIPNNPNMMVSDESIMEVIDRQQHLVKLSQLIFQTDYFRYRDRANTSIWVNEKE